MAGKRKSLPAEMHALLECGDVDALKKLFLRCDPNARFLYPYGSNVFSASPLPREFAVWAREQGADVNFRDAYGKTPIFYQASFRDGDVPLLLELGAKADDVDKEGFTPLHMAAVYGRTGAARALLDAGANVNARPGGTDSPQCRTPLEETLSENRLPYAALWEICVILLDHGAVITDRARQALRRSAEHFQRIKPGIQEEAFRKSQTEHLEKLYLLFDVEPVREICVHDGVCPIRIPQQPEGGAFSWLWDYLVPPSGKARTAQGEAIRIAGRVSDELLRNGGINWDRDYRKMLLLFPEYLRLGNALRDQDIAQAQKAAALLRNGQVQEELIRSLCDYAVQWVSQNPQVLPPLEADYAR